MLKRLYSLKRDLGGGKSYHIVISSALFSIILFFYVLNTASIFQPTVYPLIDRVNYIVSFSDKYFTNKLVDSLTIVFCTLLWFQFSLVNNKKKYIFLASFIFILALTIYLNSEFFEKLFVSISFPIVILFVIVNKVLKRNITRFDFELTINYICLFAIIIAILSAYLIISYVIFPDGPLPLLNYLNYFYLILSIFSPVYLLVISFSFPIVIILLRLKRRWHKKVAHDEENVTTKEKYVKKKTKSIHLLLVILLSIVIVMIPHFDTINQDGQIIGVDTEDYSNLLISMSESTNLQELSYKVFVTLTDGDRPLTLLLFFALSTIFYQNNYNSILENLPLILSPLLITIVYFLTWYITKNHFTSIIASLITIPSHILIGVYGGLYANWFSLIWSFLAILFLFKILDEPKRINFLIFSSLLVVLILSHTPTWNIFLYVVGLFLIVTFILNKRSNKKIYLFIIISIIPSVLLDLGRTLLISTSGVQQEINFALNRDVGIHGVQTIWENLIATSHFTLAGQVGNPLVLLLVVYWLFIAKMKEKYAIFLLVFFSLFLLPVLFGDQQIQSRFLFEIPIQIPAAIALSVIRMRIGSYVSIAICLWLIIMSSYIAANFVLIYH